MGSSLKNETKQPIQPILPVNIKSEKISILNNTAKLSISRNEIKENSDDIAYLVISTLWNTYLNDNDKAYNDFDNQRVYKHLIIDKIDTIIDSLKKDYVNWVSVVDVNVSVDKNLLSILDNNSYFLEKSETNINNFSITIDE